MMRTSTLEHVGAVSAVRVATHKAVHQVRPLTVVGSGYAAVTAAPLSVAIHVAGAFRAGPASAVVVMPTPRREGAALYWRIRRGTNLPSPWSHFRPDLALIRRTLRAPGQTLVSWDGLRSCLGKAGQFVGTSRFSSSSQFRTTWI